jgi:hypothetical protein
MQLQLRPSAARFHPLMKPMYRRAGFAGLGLTPGYTPAQQAMADAYLAQTGGGGGGAVYVAPPTTGAPACSSSPFANISDSPECIAALLAWQQQNFQAANNANFQVDYTNCVNQGLSPAVCGARTYGLTPAGGFTSDAGAGPGGSQLILDANGNPVSGVPVYTGPPLPGMVAGGGSNTPAQGARTVLSFTNLTSGDNTNFKVGDRWQIKITGAAPNAPVTVSGGMSGGSTFASQGMTNQSTTDSSGNFTMNGQMTQAQIGNWSEAWSVAGAPISSFTFNVSPVSGSTGSGQSTKTSTTSTSSVFGTLPGGSVDIGGVSVPWLGIGAAVVVLFFMMRKS